MQMERGGSLAVARQGMGAPEFARRPQSAADLLFSNAVSTVYELARFLAVLLGRISSKLADTSRTAPESRIRTTDSPKRLRPL